MNANPVRQALNVSQLRNLRNWVPEDLPWKAQTLVVAVTRPLDVSGCVAVVGELVRAHEALRSRLVTDPVDGPAQEVLPPDAVDVRGRLTVVECTGCVGALTDRGTWTALPVPPGDGAFRGVLYTRDRRVVAIKLSLSHVFVDGLGKQAAARHLLRLLDRGPSPADRVPKQASAFTWGPNDPDVRRNTAHWRGLLADAPRSCTYGAAEREAVEPVQVAQVRLAADRVRALRSGCERLGISAHTAWATALSVVAGALSGCHRQVFKTTYANRIAPADLGAVVQVAQPVFPPIAGDERDTLRTRAHAVGAALAGARDRSRYDAAALLDWLNSEERARGAVFQPAFEVNFVPTVNADEARALYGPARDELRLETSRIEPSSAKPELVLLVRHLPEPLVLLTARRPVHRQRDARRIVDDCLRVLAAMADAPDSGVAEPGIRPLPATRRLMRGHRSGVAVDVEMTRALAASAPGVDSCEVEVRRDGGLRLSALLRTAGARDIASLRTWMHGRQPWYSGSVVPDELVTWPRPAAATTRGRAPMSGTSQATSRHGRPAGSPSASPVAGGWFGADLATRPRTWRHPVPPPVAEELLARAGELVSAGVERDPLAPPVPVSQVCRELAAVARRHLSGEPGFVVLTGFPTAGDPQVVETAYWLFGRLIGRPVSQTRAGDLLVRVEDGGADISRPDQRGHRSAAALAFHADRTDVIGLLCVRPAAEGGLSLVASSKALHNAVLAERPDLLPVLYAPFPNDQRGEERTGRRGWCELPVFSRTDGHFAARYVRRFIEGARRHAHAPALTRQQVDALDLLDEILRRPGFALEMQLRPGDLQLVNNMHLLHARTAFRDGDAPDGGRLLLRLWLSFDDSPELPAEFADLYGHTAAGSYRGGVWPDGSLLELRGEAGQL